MRINWKLRLQNKVTLLSLIGIVIVAIYELAQILGLDIPIDQKVLLDFAQNIVLILAGLGIIVDPTTDGINDSSQALNYTSPRKDKTDPEA